MGDSPFLIAGGGIAGLAAALGLARIGRAARVFEQAEAFQEVGAGLQLGPNAVAALQWLGAWEAVSPASFAPREIHIRDGLTGALLQRVTLGQTFEQRFGMPYRVILRSDLQHGLLAAAQSECLIGIETSSKVSVANLELGALQSSQGTLAGAGLVAADGVHSSIRTALQGTDGRRNQSNTLYRKLLSGGPWPTGIESEVVTLWLCPGGHIVHYLVAGGKSLNIVVAVEESESQPSPQLGPLHPQAEDVVRSEGDWLAWPGLEVEANPRWSLGKTALVGDAAHAMLPYLAQGAGMALEDACILAQAVSRERETVLAFASYASRRFQRVSRMQQAARAQGRTYHMSGLTRLARNSALRLMPESLFLSRLAWIYDWRP